MHFMKLRVRKDWQELELQRITGYQKLWLSIQGLVILSTLAIFILKDQPFSYPWKEITRTILSSVLYLLVPLWVIYRSGRKTYQKLSLAAALFIGLSVLSWYSCPLELQPEGVLFSPLPVSLVLLVPLVSGLLVVSNLKTFPWEMRALGLTADDGLINLVIGAAAGGALGLHLLLTTIFLPNFKFPLIPDGAVLFWLFCFLVGLSALGEELLFRGLGFSLLFDGLKNPLWMVAVQLTIFNVLIYFVQVFDSTTISIGFLVIFYRSVLSLINTGLRFQQESLIPGMASNVIFSIVLWIIVS